MCSGRHMFLWCEIVDARGENMRFCSGFMRVVFDVI